MQSSNAAVFVNYRNESIIVKTKCSLSANVQFLKVKMQTGINKIKLMSWLLLSLKVMQKKLTIIYCGH